ncbi:HAMP domain-containing sensor histidine kinase [Novosphingobium sp. 9U]|uniref:sensor histidine kinase n=1 Tax=Novosphingobium sp. 9U TaxID=2653158 RepID=UPI0012F1DDBC|nr:HAMP domain-containing sensor histidine kinase [Novosphingobium sp. 9U]VWX54594.1 putative Histidine kinase [Novosphingobium sp. 9U]
MRVALAERDPLEARLLANAFNDLMARTERATQSLRQFTANASHQLRTPLTIVRVHADVLARDGPATLQGATALADIIAAVESLDHLLAQLIALACMDEQPEGAVQLTSFDLTALAANIVAARVTLPDARRMDVGYETAEPAIHALGDEMLVAEMIGNLLDNAIRYSRPDGAVTVRVLIRRDAPVIEIEDDGPGIAPSDQEKVWDRFYRAPGADAPPGSGLGLAIVRALGERIGARAVLAPGAGGRGTKAIVTFHPVTSHPPTVPQVNLETVPQMTAC